jgi:hypothetical protein
MVLDEQPTGFKNDGFLETGQLHKCLSAYIWYPLIFIFHKNAPLTCFSSGQTRQNWTNL